MEVAGEYLQYAEQGAIRAKDLTQQLLTFAKGGEPQKASEVLPEMVREAAPEKPKSKSFHGRVLVMDDEEGIRQLVLSLMRRIGLDAVGVPDGASAIRAYQDALDEGNPFSLTIMDLTIPGGMGGLEAIGELRRIDPNICAIVSSGYSGDPVMANYEEFGFSGNVEKPYEVEVLMECVTRLLSDSSSGERP